MSDREELNYGQVLERIYELSEDLVNHHDTKVADRVVELLDWIDAFHREGLGRLAEAIRAWRGETFLDTVAEDAIVGTFLGAYGLGSDKDVNADAEAAVTAALNEVRPLIESHGGDLEVVEIADGVVKIKMHGTCDGCPSSSATLTYGVEEALRKHWPHFRRLEQVDAPTELDASKADLECVTAPGAPPPQAVPEPQPQLLQIRGFEGR